PRADARLGDRRLAHAPRPGRGVQALRALHRAAEGADVLAEVAHPLVAAHLLGDGLDDRLAAGEPAGGRRVHGPRRRRAHAYTSARPSSAAPASGSASARASAAATSAATAAAIASSSAALASPRPTSRAPWRAIGSGRAAP